MEKVGYRFYFCEINLAREFVIRKTKVGPETETHRSSGEGLGVWRHLVEEMSDVWRLLLEKVSGVPVSQLCFAPMTFLTGET